MTDESRRTLAAVRASVDLRVAEYARELALAVPPAEVEVELAAPASGDQASGPSAAAMPDGHPERCTHDTLRCP